MKKSTQTPEVQTPKDLDLFHPTGNKEIDLKLGFLGHRYLNEGLKQNNKDIMQICRESAKEIRILKTN